MTEGQKYIFGQLNNMDAWPSQAVAEKTVDTIVAIIEAGYSGLKIDLCKLSDGRTLVTFHVNDDSPEGGMCVALLGFASRGIGFDTDEILAILQQTYREHGFSLPTPKTSSRNAK